MTRQKRPLPPLAVAGILVSTAFFLLAAGAEATTPRVVGLGGAGDFLEDDSGIMRWYGSLDDYPGAASLDFGHFNIYHGYHDDQGRKTSGPALGLRYHLGGRKGTVAGFFHTVGDDADPGSLYRDILEETFTLMYCRPAGPFSIGLVYRHTAAETEGPEPNPARSVEKRSRQDFGLGLRGDLSDGAYLDLAGEIRRTSEELTFPAEPDSPLAQDLDSDACFAVRGRLFLQLGQRTALVPLVEFVSEDRPIQPPSSGLIQGIDGRLWRLGCGIDFFPDTDHFLFAAGEWDNGRTDYSFSRYDGTPLYSWIHDWNAFSCRVGWESRFLPWLTLRSAAGYRWTRGDGNAPEWIPDLDSDDLFFTLGTGIHLGRFDLDAALSDQEPRPYSGDWGLSSRVYRQTHLSVSLRWLF